MTSWSTAAELALVFAVAPDTLELYRQRGTLPSRLDPGGRRLFDAATVATIFRRRGAASAQVPAHSFGRLGEVALGQRPASRAPLPLAQPRLGD
jgi:hypothetical protein